MSLIQQRDFTGGWNPSADQINGPENALVRMDNCVLDELGVVALRLGSSKINSTAMSPVDIRSLYSVKIGSTLYRYAQAGGSVFLATGGSYASIDSGYDSAIDLQFSSHLGYVLIASGTRKKKHDGVTLRDWGLAAPSAAATAVVGLGGDLTGDYTYKYIYVREDTSYQGKSGPSPASAEKSPSAQRMDVTVDNPTDTQATHIWLFRNGNNLDQYYRVARETVAAYTGTKLIVDNMTDADALTLNIKLESDNTTPPDNIIGISEDYFTRIFCLSSDGKLYPSRRNNLDSFSSGQAVTVFGTTETGFWIRKAFGGLYVGTSKDIYRIEGTGAENPDGTIDLAVRNLNINSPPVSSALAWDGNVLIYHASDGPRLFTGETSTPIRGETDLLWRGYTRYEVSPVNQNGRLRMAITKNILEMIVPEGISAEYSAVIWAFNMTQRRWYRHTYTSRQWRSVLREPDGTLIAGDNAGFVWKLEDAAASGDAGSTIPYTIWGRHHTLPNGKGEATILRVRMDTGGTQTGVSAYVEGSNSHAFNGNPDLDGEGVQEFNLSSVAQFRQIGLRFSGSVTKFRLYDYLISYIPVADGRAYWEVGPVEFGVDQVVWLRRLRLKHGANGTVTVTPYFDGTAKTAKTFTGTGVLTIATVDLGREYKGKQPTSLTISAGSEFPLYWVEFGYRGSGGEIARKLVRVAGD